MATNKIKLSNGIVGDGSSLDSSVSGVKQLDFNNMLYSYHGTSPFSYTATEDCFLGWPQALQPTIDGHVMGDYQYSKFDLINFPIKKGVTISSQGYSSGGNACDVYAVKKS